MVMCKQEVVSSSGELVADACPSAPLACGARLGAQLTATTWTVPALWSAGDGGAREGNADSDIMRLFTFFS
jgi:hypothetical protein